MKKCCRLVFYIDTEIFDRRISANTVGKSRAFDREDRIRPLLLLIALLASDQISAQGFTGIVKMAIIVSFVLQTA